MRYARRLLNKTPESAGIQIPSPSVIYHQVWLPCLKNVNIVLCVQMGGRCVLGVESPTLNQGVCGSNPGSIISLGKKFTPNFLPQ